MNKTNIKQSLLRSFSALVIIGALLVLPIADAGRPFPTPQGTASGTVSGCENLTDVSHVGNLEIDTFSFTATFTGTFTGTLVGTEVDVIHTDGSETVRATGVFTGSVAGSPQGTAVFTSIGTGGFHGNSTLSLQNIVGQGTNGLAGLHANLQLSPPTIVCGLAAPCPPQDGCQFEFTTDYAGLFVFASPK